MTSHCVARARGRHVKVFDAVTHIDDVVNSLNAVHLMFVALMPFVVTAVAGANEEYVRGRGSNQHPLRVLLQRVLALDASAGAGTGC